MNKIILYIPLLSLLMTFNQAAASYKKHCAHPKQDYNDLVQSTQIQINKCQWKWSISNRKTCLKREKNKLESTVVAQYAQQAKNRALSNYDKALEQQKTSKSLF